MDFIGDLYAYYPRINYPWRIAAFALGIVMVLVMRKQYKLKKVALPQAAAGTALAVYVFLMFASTVFSRSSGLEYSYELELFWTYRKLLEGQNYYGYMKEILYNIFMLMPVGALFPVATGKQGWRYAVAAGLSCSVFIEVLQLVLKRGLFEFDDIFHNVVGAAAGYGIFFLLKRRRS